MQRFKNILLVMENNPDQEEAFHRAVKLAINNQARLTVFALYGGFPESQTRLLGKIFSRKLDESIVKERHDFLEELLQPVRQDIHVHVQMIKGTAFVEIIRAVLRDKHDLVIKTSQQQRSLKTLLFGATDMHLLRKCPCPVWIIKPGNVQKNRRILAAVDLESSTEQNMGVLNQQILEMASFLAFSEQSELHIVYAWLVVGGDMMQNSHFDVQREEIGAWMTAQRKGLENRQDEFKIALQRLLHERNLSSLSPEVHLLEGEADDVIPRLALEKQVDTVIMGTLGRSGLAGIFMGNTAENILTQINCSVLALKPEGFVSPVTVYQESDE